MLLVASRKPLCFFFAKLRAFVRSLMDKLIAVNDEMWNSTSVNSARSSQLRGCRCFAVLIIGLSSVLLTLPLELAEAQQRSLTDVVKELLC